MSTTPTLSNEPKRPLEERAAAWDARFFSADFTYGSRPNVFVAGQAARIPAGSSVVDFGAGEGRNAVWLAEQGYEVTAIDFSAVGLEKARKLAAERGVAIETQLADIAFWKPDRQWDAAICTYLHMSLNHRLKFYTAVQAALRPGGLFIGQWFRPEQRTMGYTSGGPPTIDLMIEPSELEQYFKWGDILVCEPADITLAEGAYHQGPAAVVQLVFERGTFP